MRLADHDLAGPAGVEEPDDVESARALDDVARVAGRERRNQIGEQRGKVGRGEPAEGPALAGSSARGMSTRERREGSPRAQAPQHVLGGGPRHRIVIPPGDEDVADEILVTLRRCLTGEGEIPGDFLVADPDPVEHLLPAHAFHEEIVADPVPEVRERDAARLHRAAKVFHRGVVPPGDGFDGAVDPVVGDAKPELLRDGELQPLEDQLVQRTAHQRVPAGQSGGRLPEVEDEVVEPSLDLAHENGVAVDHRRDAIELGGCARPRPRGGA